MVKVKRIVEKKISGNAKVIFHEDIELLSIDFAKEKPFLMSISIYPLIIDLNIDNEILSIDVGAPPSTWQIKPDLTSPKEYKEGVVILEEEENDINKELIHEINKDKNILHIIIENEEPHKNLMIAKNLILDISENNKLGGIWILNLPEELREVKYYAPKSIHFGV